MKHDNQWLSNRIMESIKDASDETCNNVITVTDGSRSRNWITKHYDMIVSGE